MSVQKDWAACPRCQGMHYGGFHFKGACPAGGEHAQTNSFNYEMLFAVQQGPNLQGGWAACPRCQGIHFAGFASKGVCPAGGEHVQTGSFAYVLKHDLAAAPNFQIDWRACSRCLTLFYGPFHGRCPAAPGGGPHSADGSFNYGLQFHLGLIGHPEITLRNAGVSVNVSGVGFTPNQNVKLAYDITFTSADGPTTHHFGEHSPKSDAAGGFSDQIPFSGAGEFSGAQAQATDVSGVTATASI